MDFSRNNELYTNNQFTVFIENKKMKFSKISNIQKETEVEEIAIGGLNDSPYIAKAPSKKAGRLILEGGVAFRKSDVQLFRTGYYLKDPVEIVIYRPGLSALWAHEIYSVIGGTIVKWELGGIDAMGSEVLIQKVEIAYEQLLCE